MSWELALAQFLGALLIAWAAVQWALSRYKSEKTWERQLTALTEAVVALSEMRTLVGRWYDEALLRRDPPEEESERQAADYRQAVRRLREGVSAAQLVLPKAVADKLTRLIAELESSKRGDCYEEALDNEYSVINRALNDLLVDGRKIIHGLGDTPTGKWLRYLD